MLRCACAWCCWELPGLEGLSLSYLKKGVKPKLFAYISLKCQWVSPSDLKKKKKKLHF